MVNPEDPGHDKVFRDEDEALMAYAEHIVTLQAPVKAVSYTHLGKQRH